MIKEYQEGGVKEYWIVDPLRKECHFYRLTDEGLYKSRLRDEHRDYHISSLPGSMIHIQTLWQTKLPGPAATVAAVKQILENKS